MGSHIAGHVLKCKAFSNVERLYAIPMRLRVKRQNLMQQHVKNIGQRRITLNPRRDLQYIVKSTSEHSLESEPSKSPWSSVQQAFEAFYRFSRPHTVIGTVRFRVLVICFSTCYLRLFITCTKYAYLLVFPMSRH